MTRDLSVWIEQHALSSPDRVAIRFDGVEISYRALHVRIQRTAGFLHNTHGVSLGDRVAYLGFNTPECVIVLFACAKLGALYLPLNWRLAPPELDHVLGHAEPKVLISDSHHWDSAAGLVTGRSECMLIDCENIVSTSEDCDTTLTESNFGGSLDTPLLLVYTSGTTGRPKGAVLTQNALLFNALNSVHMHELTPSDHILTVLPMFHVGGLNIHTTPGLYIGATISIHPRFDPAATLAAIEKDRPSLLVLVPATIAAIVQQSNWQTTDLSSLRIVTTGSSIVPHSLIEVWHDRGIPVIQVYGSTETGPVALYQREEDAMMSVGSTGRGALHTELRIVDDAGDDVKPGASGELLLRGPNLFKKYWKDRSASEEAFEIDWFCTGDIGYRDERGYVFINDRKTDVVISGGENIYPAELEQVLDRIDGIAESSVVGATDDKWGEIPVAVVVINKKSTITAEEILSAFDGHLARYKHPRAVSFVSALPRNVMGKVLKYELRRAVENGTIPLSERC